MDSVSPSCVISTSGLDAAFTAITRIITFTPSTKPVRERERRQRTDVSGLLSGRNWGNQVSFEPFDSSSVPEETVRSYDERAHLPSASPRRSCNTIGFLIPLLALRETLINVALLTAIQWESRGPRDERQADEGPPGPWVVCGELAPSARGGVCKPFGVCLLPSWVSHFSPLAHSHLSPRVNIYTHGNAQSLGASWGRPGRAGLDDAPAPAHAAGA